MRKERAILTDDEFSRFVACGAVDLELRMLALVARCDARASSWIFWYKLSAAEQGEVETLGHAYNRDEGSHAPDCTAVKALAR